MSFSIYDRTKKAPMRVDVTIVTYFLIGEDLAQP